MKAKSLTHPNRRRASLPLPTTITNYQQPAHHLSNVNALHFFLSRKHYFKLVYVFFFVVTAPSDAGITQAARHSALNIVGDLLRRVGVIFLLLFIFLP